MGLFLRGRVAGLALVVALGGCSHTYFQFHVDAAQQAEIMGARNALAVSTQRGPNAMAPVVDLNARRAVEALIAGVTVEQTNADPQFQRLVRALYLGVMQPGVDPMAALDSDMTRIAARVGQRLASNTLGQLGLGGLAAMVGGVADDSGQRLHEMHGTLMRGQLGTCTELAPVVSYDAAILGHIQSQLAEQDPTYRDWRARVRAVHLVRFGCPSGHFLMVFTKNESERGVRAIGWQHLTPQQWHALEPRLRHALDLR